MENISNPSPIQEKRRGRPKKQEVELPKARRGRPSIEDIRKKYMTRKRGRPTKNETKMVRYVPLKEREKE